MVWGWATAPALVMAQASDPELERGPAQVMVTAPVSAMARA
jgi:hypothetical protein